MLFRHRGDGRASHPSCLKCTAASTSVVRAHRGQGGASIGVKAGGIKVQAQALVGLTVGCGASRAES